MSISVFLPVRKGSERIPEKNTRKFGRFERGLLELKLKQLIEVQEIEEIVVSSNDEKSIEITQSFQHDSRVKIDIRPEHLCTSETDLRDVIFHSANACSKQHMLWTHVTSPLFNSTGYQEVIHKYTEALLVGFDSLLTGRSYKEFLLNPETGNVINNKTGLPWPRTQDLQDLFEINNAVFMAPRNLFSAGLRVGKNPYYMYYGKTASMDIDTKEDFDLAEAFYERTEE